MRFEQISAAQVCDGVLSEFTTLLVPGGFAPNIERALGDAGADAIRSFVQSGGGFVGICAVAEAGGEGGEHGDGPMAGSGAVVYGRCGRGAVLLASPHLEDGDDERTRAPFRNMVRLCRRATADEAGAAAPPSSAAADAARAEARARYAYTRIGLEPG